MNPSFDEPGNSVATYNTARSRYELTVDGDIAFADVRQIEGHMIFLHTEVPFAQRGNGIGGRLVRSALDDVRRKGLKVVPRCWFVSAFIQQNPAYRDLLA